ncbi:hypothetical protein HY500_04555 [Candidatus Woesearchaeota archaeon]|nr:hypothetical protein [Candidatus Woesearchaeota archaeon]
MARKKIFGALTAAVLGLASQAQANETTVYTGVDTTYVNADSLRTKRVDPAGLSQKQASPDLQEQHSPKMRLGGYIFGTGGMVYETKDRNFGGGPDVSVGSEIRIIGPLYVQGQFVGVLVKGKEETQRLAAYNAGIEAKLGNPFGPNTNFIVGGGWIGVRTGDERADGQGVYSRLGLELNIGKPDYYQTSTGIRYGIDMSRIRTKSGDKAREVGSFLQLVIY